MTNVTKHSEIVKMVEEFKNLTKHTNGELCLLAGEGTHNKIKNKQRVSSEGVSWQEMGKRLVRNPYK
jgi:hypothetical protein